jgi:hypothetical protein
MTSSARGSSTGRGSSRLHQFGIDLIVAAFAAVPRSIHGIGVPVGGGMASTISAAVNRYRSVDITPTIAWVRSRGYRAFNGSDAVASLNNVAIKIRTIVDRLTSSLRIIRGSIDVSDLLANMIFADSRGMTVKDGSFKRVSYDVFIGAPVYQPARFPNRWPVAGFSLSFLL